ncbi:unnamed protein product [Cladocopium goreaui]|uniref:NADH:ubiquinone reductase (non-electrogenic) n=1 Tax=Cladocopium goreaui TaxID=2562237 RepID=A0A9P1FD87_9DINO|nr:unnamed protein product [Cladocopium goreaui]
MSRRHRVVVIGGGFGGLHVVRGLRKAPVDITLVDRRNYHLFQPLLYQVATGGLSPANIAGPMRSILRRQQNVTVLLEELLDFDPTNKEIVTNEGRIEYDTLVVAAGVTHSYFGHDEWESIAPGLKTIDDATAIRGRILSAFEQAEAERDPELRKQHLTFVIVGAGPTGVELAGALAELSRHSLKHDFRNINPSDARIIVVDAAPGVLTTYPEELSSKACGFLKRLGVEVHTSAMVTDLQPGQVTLKKDDTTEVIKAATVLWAAGVQSTPLAAKLAKATGAQTDRAGRLHVEPNLSLSGHENIFVIGDMANCTGPDDKPLPGVAPVAIQQGDYVAKLIQRRLEGKNLPPFAYHNRGNMATVGRAAAIAEIGRFRFAGFVAWLLWLFVHLMQIVQFQNRLLVLIQWSWRYFTHSRPARLITVEAGRRQASHDAEV